MYENLSIFDKFDELTILLKSEDNKNEYMRIIKNSVGMLLCPIAIEKFDTYVKLTGEAIFLDNNSLENFNKEFPSDNISDFLKRYAGKITYDSLYYIIPGRSYYQMKKYYNVDEISALSEFSKRVYDNFDKTLSLKKY